MINSWDQHPWRMMPTLKEGINVHAFCTIDDVIFDMSAPSTSQLLVKLVIAGLPMLIVFLVNELLWRVFDIYSVIPMIDIFMHWLGGFVAAWSVWLAYRAIASYLKRDKNFFD